MIPRIGKPAPDFSLPAHTGGELRLRSLRGKNVVLAFFPLAWTPV
jgi:peroxiredoxin